MIVKHLMKLIYYSSCSLTDTIYSSSNVSDGILALCPFNVQSRNEIEAKVLCEMDLIAVRVL